MTAKAVVEQELARDEILYLPISAIDPDPDQPRLDVDEDLAESIKQHGVLQAIQVRPHPVDADRWIIVDGERRYRGSKRAGSTTIPATLTLEVEDVADRLVRQIVRNEGKPLTPVEEAIAFKKIIDAKRDAGDTKFGVVQLSRELGIAKSTISDRLSLTEIPAFWLELIAKGPLQASHAPLLHKWRKVPEKYQRQALGQMCEDYRWPGAEAYSKAKKGDRIYVRELETLLRTFMSKFIKPVRDVPGYDGPTERGQFESHGDATTYAMDPSKWQPIWRKQLATRKSAQGKQAAKTKAKNEARKPKWVTLAADGGAEVVERPYFGIHQFDYDYRGYTPIIERDAWHFGRHGIDRVFDPSVLCAEIDLSKVVIVYTATDRGRGTTHDYYAATNDNAALGQARSAYVKQERDAWTAIIEQFGAELLASAEKAGREQLLFGGAAPHLVKAIVDGDPKTLPELLFSFALAARADGVDAVKPSNVTDILRWLQALDRKPAETILNAIAAAERDNLDPPPARLEGWRAARKAFYQKIRIVWGAGVDAGDGKDIPDPAGDVASIDEAQYDMAEDEEQLACKYCGCTESTPCLLGDDGEDADDADDGIACSWHDRSVPVCTKTSCIASFVEDQECAADESEPLEEATV